MLRVGCCGWSSFPKKGPRLANYAHVLKVVEINSTFYKLPRLSTAIRWRETVDKINLSFEFVVKMPKKITHVSNFSVSPEFLNDTKKILSALRTKSILFQTPPHLFDDLNIDDFKSIIRSLSSFRIFWEARGQWLKKPDKYISVAKELGVRIANDPFRFNIKYFKSDFVYFRLHGIGKMYFYKFTRDDLIRLRDMLSGLNQIDGYIFFNNIYMCDDARTFIKLSKHNIEIKSTS